MLALSTAVMRLFDSFDGGFMNAPPTGAVAYPIRKMYYNFTITGLSVVVALPSAPSDSSRSWMIRCSGTTRRAPGSPRRDLNRVGFAIVAQFVIVWTAAIAYWKLAGVEERRQAPTSSPKWRACQVHQWHGDGQRVDFAHGVAAAAHDLRL